MATGPTLVLVVRQGKQESVLIEVGMSDIGDVQMPGMVGLALLKFRNTISREGHQVRDRACAVLRQWRHGKV
jgi:hypothetical protein